VDDEVFAETVVYKLKKFSIFAGVLFEFDGYGVAAGE
jgi:hypothetical protein